MQKQRGCQCSHGPQVWSATTTHGDVVRGVPHGGVCCGREAHAADATSTAADGAKHSRIALEMCVAWLKKERGMKQILGVECPCAVATAAAHDQALVKEGQATHTPQGPCHTTAEVRCSRAPPLRRHPLITCVITEPRAAGAVVACPRLPAGPLVSTTMDTVHLVGAATLPREAGSRLLARKVVRASVADANG